MDVTAYAQFLLAFIFVLGLIGLCAVALRKFGGSISGIRPGIGTRKRLNLVEVMPIDARRRLILVRRDDREHLVLLSAHGDRVIESDIPIPPEEMTMEETRRGRRAQTANPMETFKSMLRKGTGAPPPANATTSQPSSEEERSGNSHDTGGKHERGGDA